MVPDSGVRSSQKQIGESGRSKLEIEIVPIMRDRLHRLVYYHNSTLLFM